MIDSRKQNQKRRNMKESKGKQGLPLISVGIPTCNRPENLRRTLMEITRQTYQNLEIIVSDNASISDETRIVVGEFMCDDTRVRYFRQPENQGPGFNFQFVLDQAQGEYFMWAADDDWRSFDFIDSLWNAMSEADSAIVAFSDFDVMDQGGRVVLGYPDPIATLQLMTGNQAIYRQLHFFLSNEGRAVPHVIYGLIPMRILRGFLWEDFFGRYGTYGADALFIFWLLGQGRLALVERKLFGCTVNNQKYYGSAQRRSLSRKLRTAAQRISYLLSFIKIAKGLTRLALLSVFPLKLAEVLYSMTVREPIKKIMWMLKKRRQDDQQ